MRPPSFLYQNARALPGGRLLSSVALRRRSGVALLITLLMLSLITIIAVAFLGTMNWEMSASRRNLENQKARSLAVLGMNTAVAQIRDALGPWDNPYQNFTNNAPSYYWSVSPGIITRWSYTSTTALTNIPLFSTGSSSLVNLNAPTTDGTYPIAGGASAPNISVYWSNVLKNPAAAASAANPIVGRYAFWVDDENAKININTADGTMKYQTNSLGLGNPTEVSLQELQSGGSPISAQTATNIVYIARTSGFNSTREILRASGTSLDVYTNNVFNLTFSSRSPDLNVFGQPKIPLIAVNERNNMFLGTIWGVYNCATLQAPKEFYPSLFQLPTLSFTNSFYKVSGNAANTFVSSTLNGTTWPLPISLNEADSYNFNSFYIPQNSPWANGQMIASYLAGTNAAGRPITWPAVAGSTATTYLGKYTSHQLDSMTMQILDFATSASPDWGVDAFSAVRSAPHTWRGWLSGQLVTGVGRSPKADKVLMQLTTYGSSGTLGQPGYAPPKVSAALYIETWFPSHFQGVSYVHRAVSTGAANFGVSYQANVINGQDFEQTITTSVTNAGIVYRTVVPSQLPKSPQNGGPATPDATTASLSYWGNNLLATDQGVDWEGNDPYYIDSDQTLAQLNHPSSLQTVSTNAFYNQYMGEGQGGATNASPVFQMNSLIGTASTVNDWQPGQYRCSSNGNRAAYKSWMKPSAAGGTLNVTGGIAIDLFDGSRTSDAEIVPLESKRGAATFNAGITADTFEGLSGESYANATVLARTMQSVIPLSVSVPVPGNNSLAVNSMWVYSAVTDPLVNKYPGDWSTPVTSSTAPATTMQYASAGTVQATGGTYAKYGESATTAASLTDPESYWMPTIDNNATLPNATDPPLMPRTARFPSVGYLQYLRTGVVPDDETVAYSTQHGTPFRLMNFSPSTSSTQAITHGAATSSSYPDWAMLDLFYLPSSLLSYGSPYEPLAGPIYSSYPGVSPHLTPTMVAYQNTNVVNNMYLFGTYGGATSGRINPNGSVIYTTNSTIPTPNISRTVPLQALLHGLIVNQSQTGAYTNSIGNNDFTGPLLDSGTAVNATTVAQAISTYLSANGPLRMPGEICNIPQVASYVAPNNATRNDLVRQIIGNLTTQSNSYSVWVEGQSISKAKGHSDYANFESGDQILSTVRYHFVVERYLDAGTDGVYGNSIGPTGPGLDGVVGTIDDLGGTTANPTSPRYFYRIVYAEELQ